MLAQVRLGTLLKLDPNTHVELPVDDAWLFCSNDLMAADVGFIAEASVKVMKAVSVADKSVLAQRSSQLWSTARSHRRGP